MSEHPKCYNNLAYRKHRNFSVETELIPAHVLRSKQYIFQDSEEGLRGRTLFAMRSSANSLLQELGCFATRVDHDGGMNPDRDRNSGRVVNALHA